MGVTFLHGPDDGPQIVGTRLPFVLAIDAIQRCDRRTRFVLAEALVGFIIEALDDEDGDTDLEDSEAGEPMVDARGRFLPERHLGFCERYVIREEGEVSYIEWHTRGRNKITAGGHEAPNNATLGHEDDEDDDPAECNGDPEDDLR